MENHVCTLVPVGDLKMRSFGHFYNTWQYFCIQSCARAITVTYYDISLQEQHSYQNVI